MRYALLLILFCHSAFGFDADKFLHAIALVETNNRMDLVGASGERSRYQFMRATWEQYSRIPFERASVDVAEAERVAHAHLTWVQKTLGDKATPYNVALVWNAGLGNFRRNKLLPRHHGYAERVSNLYLSF